MSTLELRRSKLVMASPAGEDRSQRELILRAQRYETDALADLFESNFDALQRYISSLVGDRARTEEVLRQVYLKALESLPKFRRFETGLSPWLFRIANSILTDRWRGPTAPGGGPSPLGDPDSRLRAALARLTPDQREVLALRFIAGLPVATVARATGRRTAHVQALQHRGLLALGRLLAPAPAEPAEPAETVEA
jgi:RNA polymerase sigma-70 factor (ECF subfamily)